MAHIHGTEIWINSLVKRLFPLLFRPESASGLDVSRRVGLHFSESAAPRAGHRFSILSGVPALPFAQRH